MTQEVIELVEPSDSEQAGWPDATFRYVHGLIGRLDAADTEAAELKARVEALDHTARDLLQHVEWLTSGLPEMLERAALTDEEGLIGAAIDAAVSARQALGGVS